MARPKKNADAKPTTRKAKLEAKLVEVMGQEVLDTILNSSPEELQERAARLLKEESEVEADLAQDEGIQKLSFDLKEMKAPYKDAIKNLKLQRHVVGGILQERSTTKS